MRRIWLSVTSLVVFFCFTANLAAASDLTPAAGPLSNQPLSLGSAARSASEEMVFNKWRLSLVPVFASQALDVSSSYGMRELNPLLAGSDGRFGAKGAGIKLGTTAGLLSVEYLIVRKYPRTARVLTKVNWSVSIVTAGFAAHNFAIH